jgi:hypothetical protein
VILSAVRKKLIAASTLTDVVPANRLFIEMAGRETPRPYGVIHGINLPPAETTQDGSSALCDGLFQFDWYADTSVDAANVAAIAQKVLQDFGGALPDGSTIQFVETVAKGNDQFQVAGTSFIFRSFFRMTAFYTEA